MSYSCDPKILLARLPWLGDPDLKGVTTAFIIVDGGTSFQVHAGMAAHSHGMTVFDFAVRVRGHIHDYMSVCIPATEREKPRSRAESSADGMPLAKDSRSSTCGQLLHSV